MLTALNFKEVGFGFSSGFTGGVELPLPLSLSLQPVSEAAKVSATAPPAVFVIKSRRVIFLSNKSANSALPELLLS
ncbi:hypothetical protein D3C78_1598570 [compost metagenome]